MSRRLTRVAAAFVAMTCVAPALAAQSPAELLDRYNKTVDPRGVLPTIQGMKSTVSMEAPAMGMSMTINAVAARPNLVVVVTEIPGLGTIRTGSDGTTAWSTDPMQGPRILQGAEASSLIENSSLNSIVRTPDQFSAMEPAGTFDVNGDMATCVKFTWKSGRESTDCFSNASGLITRSVTKQMSQAGEVEVEMLMKDYKAVSGIMTPHRIESNMMGMQMTMTTTSVEFGPMDAKLFELPPEVKALKP